MEEGNTNLSSLSGLFNRICSSERGFWHIPPAWTLSTTTLIGACFLTGIDLLPPPIPTLLNAYILSFSILSPLLTSTALITSSFYHQPADKEWGRSLRLFLQLSSGSNRTLKLECWVSLWHYWPQQWLGSFWGRHHCVSQDLSGLVGTKLFLSNQLFIFGESSLVSVLSFGWVIGMQFQRFSLTFSQHYKQEIKKGIYPKDMHPHHTWPRGRGKWACRHGHQLHGCTICVSFPSYELDGAWPTLLTSEISIMGKEVRQDSSHLREHIPDLLF